MTPRRTLTAWCAALVVAAAGAACGEEEEPAPTPRDIARVASSLGDIVYQCDSVAAGFIAEPDGRQLTRDVDALLEVYERVSPDAAYTAGEKPGPTRRTTVRKELALARRALAACAPLLAERLADSGER